MGGCQCGERMCMVPQQLHDARAVRAKSWQGACMNVSGAALCNSEIHISVLHVA
jgi:hypothetical protein